jgi:predicted metal-dependent enzyme (double-stranded beta helix superfamily)
MAFAYLDPAPDLSHPSPDRFDGPPAGSRAHLSVETPTGWHLDLLAIAQGFALSAGGITELHGSPERTWVLLAVTDLFEAWAIGWPPGGTIELHDHGTSHGVMVVADGALTETAVRADRQGLAVISTHHVGIGEHRTFGPHYVHDLSNHGDERATSVHVYGPRLTTMTYFELDGNGSLRPVRTEAVAPVGPFDTTGAHDPS